MTGMQSATTLFDLAPPPADFSDEVALGLARRPKAVPPKFLYDAVGSALFDRICDLPEYYPTRTELAILRRFAPEIAQLAGPDAVLFEPGAGSCRKVELLLRHLRPAAYVPIDISGEHLLAASARLAALFPDLAVRPACADFGQLAEVASALPANGRRIAFFPGSTIGNFEPAAAEAFLKAIGRLLQPDGALLIGVDLKKAPALLNAAYNDREGITARFNLNLLERINRELSGSFVTREFRHRAFYNETAGRIEMHLESLRSQTVTVAGQGYRFAAGETIHTENSYKYSIEDFSALAASAGYRPVRHWTDPRRLFCVHFLSVAERPHCVR